ncbi:vitamin B12 dependent-methionine synthase activation domain-containing protein [Faecalispora anaeroviscerum]|uniref:vitamin B12 dependent-methionine synthase activation domain-containing protein n=1 Tax=Faecalispora anaeroviscerum TaxID=2991836 RepID=UPI0024B9A0F2|nr:vitamin B12 dependent-methionine synthase activation domain-containing protein [Faecalispora anaeroviscerum]
MSEQVQRVEIPTEQLQIPRASVFRYMGLRGTEPDGALAGLTETCLFNFSRTVRYRACYLVLPVCQAESGVDFGAFFAPSKNLAKNLAGCDRAILFAATTGMEAEIQRKRAAVISPAQALVLDAIGTAAIECFCDALCDRWRKEFTGSFLRPRFSPGYGDLPLALQKPLLECLDSSRTAGINLTDALLMIPQKSVSAIVGIGREGCTAQFHDCTLCNKSDCEFRL